MHILFASSNKDKAREARCIFERVNPLCALILPDEAGVDFSCEESGSAFFDNAMIKASACIEALRHSKNAANIDAVLSDDSGLCVEALGGRPGVLSARYGLNEGCKNAHDKNMKLLEELRGKDNRNAYFVCCAILKFMDGRFFAVEEHVEGSIIFEERGEGGFGFDPVFYIAEKGKTYAQLNEDEKNTLSHRARAFSAISKMLL